MPFSALAQRPHIRVEIKNGDDGRFKVVWDDTENPPFDSYNIDIETIVRDAAVVREKLDLLVNTLMADPQARYGVLLKNLARAGHELYKDIFLDAGKSVQDVAIVQDWFEDKSKTEPLRLTFIVDGYVHVPWGLIFDSDPDQIPDFAEDIESYKDFWCLKYLATCNYKGLDPFTAGKGHNQNEFRLVPVVHQAEYELSRWKADDPEGLAFDKVVAEFGGPISDLKSLAKAWSISFNANKILFFYCHADGSNLAISKTESISTDQIKKQLRFPRGQRITSAVFTFLNGCSTAVGKEKSQGFIEATTREGFCGFIGTETDIPNVYALRFGAAFLAGMLQTGWTVLDLMDAMRRSHWPLSLLYQIYGSPKFRVARQPAAAMWPQESIPNFSLGPIGAKPI